MPNAFGIRSLYHQARRGFREADRFDVRYWTPQALLRTFSREIGPSTLSIDGFFGLGIQPADVDLLPLHLRPVVHSSEFLRRHAPFLLPVADSLYVRSVKA
jgi:hypothetical protein